MSTPSSFGIWHAIRALFMRAEHLSDSEIAGFLDRDLSSEERSVVEAHLEGCPECRGATAEVSRLARAYPGTLSAITVVPPLPASSGKRMRLPMIAAAALAASLAIVVLSRSAPWRDDPAPVRATAQAGPDARPIIEVTGPREDQPVERANLVFSWRATNADVYRLSVFDESGTVVFAQETTDTVLSLAGSPLPSAETLYLWRVDAIADGLTASSGVRKLRVTR